MNDINVYYFRAIFHYWPLLIRWTFCHSIVLLNWTLFSLIYTDCGPQLLFIFFLFLSFSHVHGQKQRPNENKVMYQCMNKKNQTTTTTYKMQDTEEQWECAIRAHAIITILSSVISVLFCCCVYSAHRASRFSFYFVYPVAGPLCVKTLDSFFFDSTRSQNVCCV